MKQILNRPKQIQRAETPQAGRYGSNSISGCGLPPEMVDQAIHRLAWVALFYVLAHFFFRLLFFITTPAATLQRSPFVLLDIAMVGATSTGALMCAMAWSRRLSPALMLDLGLLFEVVGALWIALAEASNPQILAMPLRGVSSISLWITIFVLVVPTTRGKTILAAFGAALMGPVGLLIGTLYYERPVASLAAWLQLNAPNFLFAAFAIVLSSFIYRLGCEVTKVREMGSYRLVELLGAGGMGEVWRAQHRMLARPSAIKLIRPENCPECVEEDGTLRRRFEREVQATATLRSPHTIAVYDFGTSDDGRFYYVMEYLEGFDLETLVKRFGPLPAERVVYFLLQVCDSLAEAHLHGLIHRDIKPRNIFVSRLGLSYDFIKVLDFGLVKSSATSEATQSQVTVAGTTTGTPAYMAPEIALARGGVDGRADIYSLGCVAYWLITGQLVFEEQGSLPVLLAHIQTPPVPPSQRTEIEIPAELEAIILSCLEKDPGRRPETAEELAARLSACRLREPWNSRSAEEWWHKHMPSMVLRPGRELQLAGSP
jgi:eukaryotic-like serine/threonine-protein kinase